MAFLGEGSIIQSRACSARPRGNLGGFGQAFSTIDRAIADAFSLLLVYFIGEARAELALSAELSAQRFCPQSSVFGQG